MKTFVLTLLASMLTFGAAFASEGKIFLPQDGKSFRVTDKDVVRIITPGPSTGTKTEVKIDGEAKDVISTTITVKEGHTFPGGDHTQVDILPTKGKASVVKVTVTITPPGGGKAEVKEYKFLVGKVEEK